MKIRLGIAQKLALIFAVFSLLIVAGAGWMAYSAGRSALEQAANNGPDAFNKATQFDSEMLGIGLLSLLVALSLSMGVAQTITRPLRALHEGAVRFGQGDLSFRIPETSTDELGALAREFNRMAEALAHKDAQLRLNESAERKRIEKDLEIAKARLQRLIDANIIGIVVEGPDGRIFEANDYYLDMLGYNRQELGAGLLRWTELIPPEYSEVNQRALAELEQFGICSLQEKEYIRKDGERIWVLVIDATLPDEEGKILAISLDITARKRAENTLRDSEDKFRYVYDHSLVGKSLTLPTGELSVNQAFCDMLGYTQEELQGTKFQEISYLEDIQESERIVTELASGKIDAARFVQRFLRKDGTIIWADVSTTIRRDAEGAPLYLMMAVLDITQQKLAEQQLEKQTQELARSNRELEQFAYVASHDLQEPLRMVTSYLQLIKRRYWNQLDKDADDFINFAVDGAERMKTLINDMLVYSRVGTRGKEFRPVDCNAVLEQARHNLALAIEEKKAIVTSSSLPTIHGDDNQLVQLFQNLISNAIKFNDNQPPKVSIQAESRNNEILFTVQDNGIGIDPQFSERIFIIFQRLHGKDEYSGTGIGLAICKKIVERHSGRIWVESQPGAGSKFCFTIQGAGANRRDPRTSSD